MARVSLIAFTERGVKTACRIAEGLREPSGADGASCACVSAPSRLAEAVGAQPVESLAAWAAESFAAADALVFVSAAGIAVRAVAPHVRDKFSDPAVVCVDEAGAFAVPLLSGHVGGANRLARRIAEICGGQAVVSTATDVNGLFAVDEWAARRGLQIRERGAARRISARLLDGGLVGCVSAFPIAGRPPEGVVVAGDASNCQHDLGFCITLDEGWSPFAETLHLVPCAAVVGVGCRRGASPDVLRAQVDAALSRAHVSPCAVRSVASIDVKRGEPAIASLAQEHGWDARFFSAKQLAAVEGEFSASDFVAQVVGVDNVCERAAMLAAGDGARLVVPKQAASGTTVAVALCPPALRW